MGTKIAERITTTSLGLKSVDRSGFIRFGVNGRGKSSNETLTDGKEEEEEESLVTRSMDRFLEKQTAESIRQTMQAQEDIFKQQVRELHTVYNTQKMMMDQLKHRSQYWTISDKDQTGSKERTGSCSGVDLENTVRATKTTTDHIEESELELTLSIGMSSSSTNKDMDYSSTTSLRSSSDNCNNQSNNNNNNNSNNQESSGPNTPMSSSSTTSLDREKKRPHWLFQGLSINRTS
uniref:Uncharacterized protein n=1 Tax=Noccaea caerulescens TaxID=107243 RepID=A0A1J3EWL7_NOCCA